MALQKLLALASGKIAEYSPLQVSAGAGSAGAIPALNSAGQIDLTMMPTGIGPDTASILASEALAAAALVNVWSNGGTQNARNADGSASGKLAVGFVLAAVASGAMALVYGAGIITGLSGLTPGAPCYLSDTTPGQITQTAPTTSGHVLQQVGVALSPTTMQFQPLADIVRA